MISFPAPSRGAGTAYGEPKQQQQQQRPRQPQIERGPPPRRNTEDFVFTGVLDPSGSSSIVGSDAAAGAGAGAGVAACLRRRRPVRCRGRGRR